MEDNTTEPRATLCDALDRLLNSGVVVHGDLVISVAEVDLLRISLRALVAAADVIAQDMANPHHDRLATRGSDE